MVVSLQRHLSDLDSGGREVEDKDDMASLSLVLFTWSSSSLGSIRRGWCCASAAELRNCFGKLNGNGNR